MSKTQNQIEERKKLLRKRTRMNKALGDIEKLRLSQVHKKLQFLLNKKIKLKLKSKIKTFKIRDLAYSNSPSLSESKFTLKLKRYGREFPFTLCNLNLSKVKNPNFFEKLIGNYVTREKFFDSANLTYKPRKENLIKNDKE